MSKDKIRFPYESSESIVFFVRKASGDSKIRKNRMKEKQNRIHSVKTTF